MILDYFILLIIRSFQSFLRLLPENGQQKTGLLLGRTGYCLLRTRRRVAIANIKRAFRDLPGNEIERIARRCFENLGVNFVESLVLPFLPKTEYRHRFHVENNHFVEDAFQNGKGLIAIVFHYANWEIMGLASHFLDRDIIALARPLKGRKQLNNFLIQLRSTTGLTIIPNANTSRDVIRYLNQNKIVAILSDQREKRSRAVFVEFFGVKVPTLKGPVMIGMKTGSPVIPAYLRREGFLRYAIVFSAPLEMERGGDIGTCVYNNTRKINAFLESIILEKPDEWFWVHQRWGRNPK